MTKKWNDDLIAKEIFKVMDSLQIERMPSNSEIVKVIKNSSLSNKIVKTYGFLGWAERLNLETKSCETKFGHKYEKDITKMLQDREYEVLQMSTRFPYDLLVNNNIKIDVKSAKKYHYSETGFYYTFNLEKKYATCDIYICCCINDDDKLEKVFIIPSKFLIKNQLSVGNKSEYDKFIDRWDYIEQYDKFYKSITE